MSPHRFQAKRIHECFKSDLPVNEGFVPPERYLGDNVEKVKLEDGQVVWSTNCVDYLKIAIENVKNTPGVDNTALKNYGDRHRPY